MDEPLTDKRADSNLGKSSFLAGSAIVYFLECPLWQTIEPDNAEGFEMLELLMEHKILKGRGKEIYYEYAANKAARSKRADGNGQEHRIEHQEPFGSL
jgi:hypothetical protein